MGTRELKMASWRSSSKRQAAATALIAVIFDDSLSDERDGEAILARFKRQ